MVKEEISDYVMKRCSERGGISHERRNQGTKRERREPRHEERGGKQCTKRERRNQDTKRERRNQCMKREAEPMHEERGGTKARREAEPRHEERKNQGMRKEQAMLCNDASRML
jgi:hypothetical protein